jgi:hypothetical protein
MNAIPEQEVVETLRSALPWLLTVYAFGSRVQGTAALQSLA